MRKFIGMPGKGMIVCATREICAKLYEQIIEIKPDWHSDDITKGKIKVVYTGGPGDEAFIQKHVRRPSRNKIIQRRARSEDPQEELELVIVQSMWLTGFDSPPLHTLYLDKPMRGAALMQALARVNRTFRDKQDGLLVGYAPLTENLYAALAEYTVNDQTTRPVGRDTDEALGKVRELHDVIGNVILAGYDWRARLAGRSPRALRNAVNGTVNYLRDPATPGNQVEEGEPTPGGPVPATNHPGWPGSTRSAQRAASCTPTGTTSPSSKKSGSGWSSSTPRTAGPAACPYRPTLRCTCAS